MGYPVAGNPTQYMVEKAFGAAGLDWHFLTLEVAPEALHDALAGFRAMGFRGATLIQPHGHAAGEYLDELSRPALLTGVADCIPNEDGRLIGDNMLGKGFVRALEHSTPPEEQRYLIFGANERARAVAIELAHRRPAAIAILTADERAGQSLIDVLAHDVGAPASLQAPDANRKLDEFDVLISAEAWEPGAVFDDQSIQRRHIVADLSALALDSALLHRAAERECKTIDALSLLVCQQIMAVAAWSGVETDFQVMRDAAEEFLSV